MTIRPRFPAVPAVRPARRAGFTLTELLVVVFILAALAAIAVPTLGSYRRSGLVARADGVVQALVSAEKAYRQRHGAFWKEAGGDALTPANTRQVLGVNLAEADDFAFSIPTARGASVLTVEARGREGSGAADVVRACTYDATTGETTCGGGS